MKIRLGTATVCAGKKGWGQLRVREGGKHVRIGVAAINGVSAGKHVVLLANQHGGEINGIEAVREAVTAIDPCRLKGTVFAIPSANPKAAMLAQESWPENEDNKKYQDRNTCPYNMNRRWPGQRRGLLVDRIVYEIWNKTVMARHCRASLLMDFHCHQAATAVYARDEHAVSLGVVSGIPVVIHTRSNRVTRHYSNEACNAAGIAAMTIELGGQRVFDSDSISAGKQAILNMLKFSGMLPGRLELPERTTILDPWRHEVDPLRWPNDSVHPYAARHDGLVRFYRLVFPHRFPYYEVKKNEPVAAIVDPFTGCVVETCCAPENGVLFAMRTQSPVCHKGDKIFQVTSAGTRIKPADYIRRLIKKHDH